MTNITIDNGIINTILLAIANYIISYYAVREDGPKDILVTLRKLLGISIPIEDIDDKIVGYESNDTLLANMFSCEICLCFWTGLGIGLAAGLEPLHILVLIGLTTYMHRRTDG